AEKNYKRKITKSMRAQALFSVLSKKLKDGEIIFVDSLSMPDIKTKSAATVIDNLSKVSGFKVANKTKKILTALAGRNEKTEKSFRNIPALELVFVKNLNPLDVLNYRYLLIENPEESVKFLESRA
ncbi:MAG TPA: 50S ribosomal protein L4, partial [Candidatus Paceibacterota bacterium]